MDSDRKTVHLFHHRLRHGGGMERYARSISRAFVELGHRVVFHARQIDPEVAHDLGIEADLLSVPRFPRKLEDYHYFRQTEKIRKNLHGIQFTLTRIRINDIAVCGGTHRGYLKATRKFKGPADWLQIWMEAQAYRSARWIISHSRLCSAELEELYSVQAQKIVTLYPPIDAEFRPLLGETKRAELREELRLPKNKVVFLFPSTGHSRKGLDALHAALKGYSDRAVLAVAGSRPLGFSSPLLQHLGYIKDMPAAYQAADFTILGSSYEPFGLVGPESLLCGTRLVFEEKIGCLETVQSGYVFPFAIHNSDSIHEAVEAALQMAQTGRHRILAGTKPLVYNPSAQEHVQQILNLATGNKAKSLVSN